ncbi:hypothetical protein D6783_03920 [Candidatus Woesearchaeota archaeon]|nr:MAG: hypothetical protein D6783_03920 [Candidatus Woesearchaeota archaeon]
MSRKRNRLQIIYDILFAIREKNGKIKPTHILYKSNLSHQMMEEYLNDLWAKGFIIVNNTKKGRTFAITDKGNDYLNKYKMIVEFMESFGLDT